MTVYRDAAQRQDEISDLIQLVEGLRTAERKLTDAFHDEDQGRGYPSGHGGPSGEVSDRTSNAAMNDTPRRGELNGARRQFDAELSKARKAICSALGTVAAVTQPAVKPPTALDKADPASYCSSCSRATKHPPHRADRRRVGKEPLCSWCFEFKQDNGELPDLTQITAHVQGRKVLVRQVLAK